MQHISWLPFVATSLVIILTPGQDMVLVSAQGFLLPPTGDVPESDGLVGAGGGEGLAVGGKGHLVDHVGRRPPHD